MPCTSQRDVVLAVSAEVVSATSTYGVPVNAHFGIYRTDCRTFALTEPIYTNYTLVVCPSVVFRHTVVRRL